MLQSACVAFGHWAAARDSNPHSRHTKSRSYRWTSGGIVGAYAGIEPTFPRPCNRGVLTFTGPVFSSAFRRAREIDRDSLDEHALFGFTADQACAAAFAPRPRRFGAGSLEPPSPASELASASVR